MPNWLSTVMRGGGESSKSVALQSSSPISSFYNAVYYPSWRVYRERPPSSLNVAYVSHVFYAFAWPTADGLISHSDEYADNQILVDGVQGCMRALVDLKRVHSHLKTILSIGGGGTASTRFPALAASDHSRHIFAQSVKAMVDSYGFDGVDIDWEHPSDPRQGHNYIALLATLRSVMPTSAYFISTALPAGEWALRNINLQQTSIHVDLINLMTYDFSGPWTDRSGHQAQLYTPRHPHSDAARVSCASAINFVTASGVPSHKILLGVPAYGRSFLGATGPGQHFSGSAGEDGVFEYSELPRPDSREYIDRETGSAFCVGGDGGFVSYDTPQTVRMKAAFVRERRLAGMFFWTGTGDVKGARSLVETGYNVMHDL